MGYRFGALQFFRKHGAESLLMFADKVIGQIIDVEILEQEALG
jgi:hypothetical protein